MLEKNSAKMSAHVPFESFEISSKLHESLEKGNNQRNALIYFEWMALFDILDMIYINDILNILDIFYIPDILDIHDVIDIPERLQETWYTW